MSAVLSQPRRLPRLPDAELVRRVHALRPMLRPTPVVRLDVPEVALFAKLEYTNPVGSIKDRTAYWILRKAIERGDVTRDTTLVESSSGNFASALAAFCRLLGLRFIPVIDPNITGFYESFLRRMCQQVVRVEERDDTGGFLKTRLAKVAELCNTLPDAFWTNQYGNPDGMEAHFELTGAEVCQDFRQLDYAFIGVSTGGTIAGLSQRLKLHFPEVRVVAVDAVGSVIFGGPPRKRHIPGIGASVTPGLLRHAQVDEVVHVSEAATARACQELLERHGLLVGGSSGTLYAAIRSYRWPVGHKPHVLFLCADRGTAYLDTVFNPEWCTRLEDGPAE